jgi:hypothetical protein
MMGETENLPKTGVTKQAISCVDGDHRDNDSNVRIEIALVRWDNESPITVALGILATPGAFAQRYRRDWPV